MRWDPHPGVSLASGRVTSEDADRQTRTAAEILRRLEEQPGLVLADEVGMGKTFVALAVAAGVVRSTNYRRPVVVMVPPPVAEKWPNDWKVFRQLCLSDDTKLRATEHPVRKASEFLKLLDDPADRRQHIIFLTHGALRSALSDSFIELAVIRQAFSHQHSLELKKRRAAFPRWAHSVLGDGWFNEERTQRLLELPPARWIEIAGTRDSVTDDPVPFLMLKAIGLTDLTDVRSALAEMPLHASPNLAQRLSAVRRQLRAAIRNVWTEAMGNLSFRLPLLILDEAHHVKNANQLASLFFGSSVEHQGLEGALTDKFDRMLFLTATPFQLGHHELISVISRFGAVRLTALERQRFEGDLVELRRCLDRSQADALRLDSAWARLGRDNMDGLAAGWWTEPSEHFPEALQLPATAAQRSVESFTAAQHALRPWVLRHCRDRRREVISGAGIMPVADEQRAVQGPGELTGINIAGESVLPFLLAARAESIVSLWGLRNSTATRALFSEALASSYDAFLRTETDEPSAETSSTQLPAECQWYVNQITRFIPRGNFGVLDSHPKIHATTSRVVDLWSRGEKVLVFVFFRATGRALRRSISSALQQQVDLMITHAGFGSGDDLQRRSESQLKEGAPAARVVDDSVRNLIVEATLNDSDRDAISAVMLRFMRTPTFQTRYLDLGANLADSIRAAFLGTGPRKRDLAERIVAFAERVSLLTQDERLVLWEDLMQIQTGDIRHILADESAGTSQSGTSLPNVRLANGETDRQVRLRLMRAFNSPFFPEVLIASSVFSEGVDLHLDCRHVIHHDLDWNPSVLEQRTGRVDRVGSLAERTGEPIVVFEPFLAGTQDERLFRVVKDREAWFNVVMGAKAPSTQWELDQLAERVPLPADLADTLSFQLGV
jgi:ERCC4-related helicase